MRAETPRLRMFAGPNGSGKTTVKNGLHRSSTWFGVYINPDEIEREIRSTGRLSVESMGLPVSEASLQRHFAESTLLRARRPDFRSELLYLERGAIKFPDGPVDSYVASVLADYLRRTALSAGRSFSFETVMSSPDKVELLATARSAGYRTYLYYIATEDPEINVGRVGIRVAQGGHDVPHQKIIDRYHRSIGLLREAIRYVNRGFLFDTSGDEPWFFAETTDGVTIELKSDEIPNWFAPLWDSFDQIDSH